jgi:hypothetical protein
MFSAAAPDYPVMSLKGSQNELMLQFIQNSGHRKADGITQRLFK